MKARRVIITLELTTSVNVKGIKGALNLLEPLGKIEQVQVNVIKAEKKEKQPVQQKLKGEK